jgi:hypothetical protein
MKLPFESHYIFMRTSYECFKEFSDISPTIIPGQDVIGNNGREMLPPKG